MNTHPIFRVRRLALAARIVAGGQPSDADYRRAALEPFDAYLPPWERRLRLRSASVVAQSRPLKRLPGPQF